MTAFLDVGSANPAVIETVTIKGIAALTARH
jgi:hypothetical protein